MYIVEHMTSGARRGRVEEEEVNGKILTRGGAAVVLIGLAGGLFLFESGAAAPSPAPAASADPTGTPYPVRLVQPDGVGEVDSGLRDIHGRPIGVGCATCHAEHVQPPFVSRPEELREVHKDMPWAHGEQPCFSCHVQEDRSLLHLADGERVGFEDAMRLCAQCHGPQARDYARGAHGGMLGYWDLSRGPRVRNTCLGCHDAHQPAYPQVKPVFAPRDRFLGVEPEAHGPAEEE